ncbi:MAG TPA: HlyD family secretion protein [Gemmatimonas aurantiaca]|uniref:Multidrug resistance protein n=2 Tax=Gemmatimonas aurantiaca TaxID=173480 RepID=C1A5R2_GEMAT|nr:HlyD family secretion protein [Gemmatimonas aurantiaca]BAH37572.1 multidrug resistance protein [Gemmatimonas aurantiaca T-27]HCT58604.1 HlyD family secretion protein [Gemmatimonas aurantiaca]
MARPNIRLLIPIAALVAVGIWGYQRWSFGRSHESTDNAQIDGHIVPVVAKVGGYVTAINAIDNGHVDGKHVLVKLDTRELEVKLAQAEAELAAARASAGGRGLEGQAVTVVRTASSQRDVGSAQVDAAKAQLIRAQADLTRAKELAGKQIISMAQLDGAQATFDAATANLEATQRQVLAATGSIANAQAGVRLAQARLAAAEAARDNAALQLSYATVEAPLSGIVSRKQVELGQLIQAGQAMMSIVADTGLFVTANMKETQLARLRVGQKVDLEIDAYEATAEGEVESIASATGAKFALLPPDNATGNFTKVVQRVPVRIRVTKDLGKDRPLRPGMSVLASVVVR